MSRNNFKLIQEAAKKSAIEKIKRELQKNKEFYLLKKLNNMVRNGTI